MFRMCFVDYDGREFWRNARDESERRRIVGRLSRIGAECALTVEFGGEVGESDHGCICRGDDLWISAACCATRDTAASSNPFFDDASDSENRVVPIANGGKMAAAMAKKSPAELARIAESARRARERRAMLRAIAKGNR